MPTRSRCPWLDLLSNLTGPLSGQRGSILIATVIAVTIVATLGTAMYSFVSTSSLTQIGSMSDTKAYYLAESGGHYAIKQLVANVPSSTTACNALLAGTYTVTNAGQFTLQSFAYTATSGFHEYRFAAKGAPSDGSASRSINYIIKVPSAAGVDIPFDGNGSTLNADNWNVSGEASLNTSSQKVALNDGNADTQISLDWTKSSSTMPNLLEVWNDANGLLSYEAQVKVTLGSSKDVMAGISFRLKTGENTTITDDSFYGLSYLWCKDGDDLSICGSDNSKTYIVLWKKASTSQTKTVIGKRLASEVSSSLVNNGRLVDWATLVVRVQEQFNPSTGVRENLIYAFAGYPMSNPSSNQKGTTHWDYTKYLAIPWSSISSPAIDCAAGQKSCVSDSTFTTTDFNTQPQDEIGLHAFGDEKGEVTDLALRFNFNGGKATSY